MIAAVLAVTAAIRAEDTVIRVNPGGTIGLDEDGEAPPEPALVDSLDDVADTSNKGSVLIFPEIDLPVIQVSVEYPGAAPREVEEAICVRIEEELQGLQGIRRVRSSSDELRRVVREAGIDVIQSNDMRTDFTCRMAGARRGLGVPWAPFVHGWIGFRRKGADLLYGFYEIMDRWSVRGADAARSNRVPSRASSAPSSVKRK